MLLSIYTFVKDGIFLDYHVVDMLKHHLPLADEIIVNEAYSSDGTFERISQLDPKIKIYRTHWGKPTTFEWFTRFKNDSRSKCTGEWCILLDCDEFIPEWEFDRLRRSLANSSDVMIPVRLWNFYGNYKVYHAKPEKVGWPGRKMLIHRNLPEIEVWGDGSNVRLKGQDFCWESSTEEFTCHHFGFVRHPARLRQKWRNLQGNVHGTKRKFKLPSFLFDWRPHNWKDPLFLPDLAIYRGPYIRAVQDNPQEFVRDRFELYDHLESHRGSDESEHAPEAACRSIGFDVSRLSSLRKTAISRLMTHSSISGDCCATSKSKSSSMWRNRGQTAQRLPKSVPLPPPFTALSPSRRVWRPSRTPTTTVRW